MCVIEFFTSETNPIFGQKRLGQNHQSKQPGDSFASHQNKILLEAVDM